MIFHIMEKRTILSNTLEKEINIYTSENFNYEIHNIELNNGSDKNNKTD
jgi:hypothetical protein